MSKGSKREKVLNKNILKTAKRLLRYVTDTYKLQIIIVFICIFISAGVSRICILVLKIHVG